MSATLGEGGDLERITARKRIHRIGVPDTWKTRGIGRRLFFFPEMAFEGEDTEKFLLEAMNLSGCSIALAASENEGNRLKELVKENLPKHKVFGAKQLEESKSEFSKESKAVAVVANRYDGIDLEEDECRLLVISGLPKSVNLQEKFFVQGPFANLLTRDRLLTRIIQAVGRCTRSETDYAGVVLIGSDLNDFFLKLDQRKLLHPEIQAEVEFGVLQSEGGITVDGLLGLWKLFLEQSSAWDAADSAIIDARDSKAQNRWEGSNDLQAAVTAEIDYQYSLWTGNMSKH